MPYNLDLSTLSVLEYKELLKNQTLLPGRRILLENIDRNFENICQQGISDIAQLRKQLATPRKMDEFVANTGISEGYLTILKREMCSLEQKPVSLTDFPGVDIQLVTALNSRGIKTSKDYYESAVSVNDEMFCLCDLVRINGVGAIAARAFYEAGYRSVSDVAGADAALLLEKVTAVNDARGYYKARLGVKDMQFCIDFASLLIKYGG